MHTSCKYRKVHVVDLYARQVNFSLYRWAEYCRRRFWRYMCYKLHNHNFTWTGTSHIYQSLLVLDKLSHRTKIATVGFCILSQSTRLSLILDRQTEDITSASRTKSARCVAR